MGYLKVLFTFPNLGARQIQLTEKMFMGDSDLLETLGLLYKCTYQTCKPVESPPGSVDRFSFPQSSILEDSSPPLSSFEILLQQLTQMYYYKLFTHRNRCVSEYNITSESQFMYHKFSTSSKQNFAASANFNFNVQLYIPKFPHV